MVESVSSITLEQLLDQPDEPVKHGGCGSCGSGKTGARCGNGLEKIYPTTAVRFGYMRYIGEFSHAPDMLFTCGAKVVIQTRRGLEIGEQVSLTCGGCDKSVSRDQMKQWVDSCGEDSYVFDAGRILREATAADLGEYARIQGMNLERTHFAQASADSHNLPISIVECETLFGGERMVFYFTAELRVDFRAMVRDLTQEFRTRIEMRQVGARDEARLLADYETCGREVCCKVFLKTLRPITMRMAKLQKATLDPSQVSGRCGRLKCCLRYEHVGYEELDKQLPRAGLRIRTNHGDGVIINRQVLTQLVQLRKDDGTLITVVAEDITAVGVEAAAPPPEALPGREGLQQDRPVAARPTGPQQAPQGRRPDRPRTSPPVRPPQQPQQQATPRPQPESGERPAHGQPPTGGGPPGSQSGPDSMRRRNRRRRGGRIPGGPPQGGPRREGPAGPNSLGPDAGPGPSAPDSPPPMNP